MKLTLRITIFFLFVTNIYCQTNGISYQAVIFDTQSKTLPGVSLPTIPLLNKKICLRFTFLDYAQKIEYQETLTTSTDGFGIVNLVIGSGNQTAGYASSFNSISWDSYSKNLIVELDINESCSNFDEISNQILTTAPFSFKSFTADNITGVASILNGGTGATTVLGAKTNLGLENVDNTSDAAKPISNATQTALNLKANSSDVTSSLALKEDTSNKINDVATDGTSDVKFPSAKAVKTYADAKVVDGITDAVISSAPTQNAVYDALALKANLSSPTFTGTVSGIDKTMVGLGNVENTSDAAKPISNATQTALNLKANTSDVTTSLALKEDTANKTNDVASDGISDVKFPSAKAVKSYTDAKVVDGITDAVTTSAPTQNAVYDALTLKANLASPTFTGTVFGIDKTMVGLGNVDNTSDLDKPISTSTQTALNLKADASDVTTNLALKEDTANKTLNITTDGTSDLRFPSAKAVKTYVDAKVVNGITDGVISSAPSQNAVYGALALKANLASPTFTGTVSGIDKTMVGLGNVDNTSDAAKPISNATQAELNLKANASEVTTSMALKEDTSNKTINITTDGTSDVKFPSAKAVKTYVEAK